MKTLLLLFVALAVTASDITDLGVLSSRRGIVLEKCTNRADFAHFKIELLAQRWPSNSFTFTTTNSLLTLQDFLAMPPGPCLMGVREVTADGDESSLSLFKVDIRREPAAAPRAHVTQLAELRPAVSPTTKAMIAIRTKQAVPLPPLPDGTNRSYSEHMIRMHDFYTRRAGARRSE